MPATGTSLGHLAGTATEANLAYINRRVQNGINLVITEIIAVHPSSPVSGYLFVYS